MKRAYFQTKEEPSGKQQQNLLHPPRRTYHLISFLNALGFFRSHFNHFLG